MKKIITISILIIGLQSCINQKVTETNIFNPVKEFELSKSFVFNRQFFETSDSVLIESWYLTESNAKFNLVYLSGNGSNVRSAVPFFNQLGEQFNLNIYTFNYRGYGLSYGEPSVKGIVEDGKSALNYFYDKIGDKGLPTIILGYSLGGFVAMNLIQTEQIDKAIIMSTFTSIEELEKYLLKEALPGIVRPFLNLEIDTSIYQLDNLKLVENSRIPILFIHGEKDDFIPPSMSYRLYNLSPSKDKAIKIIEGADHRMVLKDAESNKLVVDEIRNFLQL